MTRTGAPTLAAAAVLALGLTGIAPAAVGEQVYDGTVVQASVPTLRMRSAATFVKTAPGGSSISASGGTPLQIAPSSVTVQSKPPLDGAGVRTLLTEGKMGAVIRWGTDGCTTDRWIVPSGGFATSDTARPTPKGAPTEALTPGSPRRLCVALTSPASEDELIQRFAGRTLLVRTGWAATAVAPSSWTSTATTNALQTYPLPPAVAAPKACTPAKDRLTLAWAWPSASSTPVPKARGIHRWVLLARPRTTDAGSGAAGHTNPTGRWTQIAAVEGHGDARALDITPALVSRAKLAPGTYDVTARAYPFPGVDGVYSDSVDLYGVTVGTGSRLSCSPTGKNTGELMHSDFRSKR